MTGPATSSGRQTSSAAIAALPGRLYSIQAEGDGTNAATIIIYDNASAASGTILCKILLKAGVTYDKFELPHGVVANNGLYLSLSGTGAAAIVHYSIG